MTYVDTRNIIREELAAILQPLAQRFITFDNVLISPETTIWAPATGKRFRLLGGILSCTTASANLIFRDGVAGTVCFILPNAGTNNPLAFDVNPGIRSAAINNALTVVGAATTRLNGVIWGREE